MQLYIDDDTYKKLVHSIANELAKNLGDELINSCIIGIGESGITTAQTIYEFYNQKCKIKRCDVDKKTRTIQGLSVEDIHNKSIIICDSIINTGTTVEIVREHLIKDKPKDIKILSIVLRNGSPLIPNYYALMIEKNDDIFYNIDNYPIYKYHFGLIRKIKNDDVNKHFESGNPQIDKWCIEDYLHCSVYSQLYSTYIFDVNNEILGILHFFEKFDNEIYVIIIGTARNKQNMKIGSSLMSFLFKYCKFNKKQYITLSAFEDVSKFYEKMGFKPRKKYDLPNFGRLVEMEYKVY
jgi:hypoxanthine phosphoribosyltransferase